MRPTVSVSQFVEIINQTLEMTYPVVDVLGEIASYREWNDRLAFIDLKDEGAVVSCMIPLHMLTTPVEEGMQVSVSATPKVTNKGRFSLNIRKLELVGEGALRRAFELLKTKLEQEGLFAAERKRALPRFPGRIAVVTSLDSAAYQDFLKTVQQRWGGLEIVAVHTQVQGEAAPEQLVGALSYVNQLPDPVDVVVVTRGGGSLEDLAAFNSEPVVRAIASSRVPTVVGVGHETDTSLADMAADVRAATPTDVARHIVPDRHELLRTVRQHKHTLSQYTDGMVKESQTLVAQRVRTLQHAVAISRYRELIRYGAKTLIRQQQQLLTHHQDHVAGLKRTLDGFDPRAVLRRGYAVVRHQDAVLREAGRATVGDQVVIQLHHGTLDAEVTDVKED